MIPESVRKSGSYVSECEITYIFASNFMILHKPLTLIVNLRRACLSCINSSQFFPSKPFSNTPLKPQPTTLSQNVSQEPAPHTDEQQRNTYRAGLNQTHSIWSQTCQSRRRHACSTHAKQIQISNATYLSVESNIQAQKAKRGHIGKAPTERCRPRQ